MMIEETKAQKPLKNILTQEQEALLEQYITSLDNFFEHIKASETIQVEIETLHLKKILSK